MRDITLGQYYPTGSIVHKLDPRVKLFLSTIYLIAIFFARSYVIFAFSTFMLIFIISIAKLPFMTVLKSLKSLIFILIFTSIINIVFNKTGKILYQQGSIVITAGGIDIAIKTAWRLISLIIASAILTLTTTPTELTDAIESMLKPLKYIKFPVHEFALVMSLALRFVPGFIEETDKIIMAQKSRGANFDSRNIFKKARAYVPVLIPLFVSAFSKADQLALALDSRCYSATKNRTRYRKLKIKIRDIVASTILILAVVYMILDYTYLHFADYMENYLIN